MEKEVLELIAIRIKGKGDTWKSVTFDEPQKEFSSLTDMLEAYYQSTQLRCDFKLSPIKGEIHAIKKEVVKEQPLKKFDIYGEKS